MKRLRIHIVAIRSFIVHEDGWGLSNLLILTTLHVATVPIREPYVAMWTDSNEYSNRCKLCDSICLVSITKMVVHCEIDYPQIDFGIALQIKGVVF